MLSDALVDARRTADLIQFNARQSIATKAAGGGGGLSIPLPGGAADELPQTRQNYAHASSQYAANKGWVHAAVRLISQRVAGQPIRVARVLDPLEEYEDVWTSGTVAPKRKSLDGTCEALEMLRAHPLLDLLADPNDLMTTWSLISTTVVSLELTGRSLWWLAPASKDNSRIQLLPLPTSWIVETSPKRQWWKIRLPGWAEEVVLPGNQIVHFFYPDPSNPWGCLSPLQTIAAAVNADDFILRSQARSFNTPLPGLVVTMGKSLDTSPGLEPRRPELSPDQRRQIINSIIASYSGEFQGQPIVVDSLIESVARLGLAPDELSYLDSSKITKSRILESFGVSHVLLGGTDNSNRATAVAADELFINNKVNPLITLLSQVMTEWLGPMFASDGERLKVWIEAAESNDPELTLKQWTIALNKEACTKNEFRRVVLKMPDMPGGDAEPASGKEGDADPAAATATTTNDVQATALNGAQIESLMALVERLAQRIIPPDAARAILRAAFPSVPEATINTIVDETMKAPPLDTDDDDAAAFELAKRINPYTMKGYDARR